MSVRTFTIKSLQRFPEDRATDRIDFSPGVNLIVGERDAGKTKWLSMLDYVLGDSSTPLEAIGQTLSEKYEGIKAVIVFADGEEVSLERWWRLPKGLHKILINGEPIASDAFDQFIFGKLGIPIIKFPRGNPFADKSGWQTLGWRSLFRSIYRQERFWSTFVDKQPDAETAACLIQFLGAATKQFPESHEQLAVQVRQLQRLEGQRDAFEGVLHTITLDLLKQKELTVAVTSESIKFAKDRIGADITRLREEREHLIEQVTKAETNAFDQRYQALRVKRDSLQRQKDALLKNSGRQDARSEELRQQVENVSAEITRLKRVRKADTVLSGIKVSHCPVCELPAEDNGSNPNVCYLCGKPHADAFTSADSRLDFELDQLQEEHDELNELVEASANAKNAALVEINAITVELEKVDADLKPAVRFAMTNVPPDLAVIDLQLGRLNEQLSQLARVEQTLKEQSKLLREIGKLEGEIDRLRALLKEAHAEVDFRQLSNILSDGMNSYLNSLNENHPGIWNKGRLEVELRARSFNVTIRESSINTELGAASNAIALFAFHYALLQLSADPECHYPGLVILDFPLTLASGDDLKDAENYLMEPFVKLLQMPGFNSCQLIAAGRAFHGLAGVKQIELKNAY